jgi:hypothetical protein
MPTPIWSKLLSFEAGITICFKNFSEKSKPYKNPCQLKTDEYIHFFERPKSLVAVFFVA